VAKIEITRTELVWPGKYDEEGRLVEPPRVSLPFQVIETVNESRATRESKKNLTLFDYYEGDEGSTFEEGWKNKLIWGDNLLVMGSLLEKFAGKIDLIYIDPPFATGADFNFSTEIGEESQLLEKEQSLIEEKAYRDTWGRGTNSYLSMIAHRARLMYELLSPAGALVVHVDWRVDYLVRSVLDDIFGSDNFRNAIAWSYRSGGASRKESLPRKHDTLLLYAKGSGFQVNAQTERQYLDKPFMGSKQDAVGRYYVDTILRDVIEGAPNILRDGEVVPYNCRPVLNLSSERLGYDTQKPEGLLQLLLEVCSSPGDLVADFFAGSGTTVSAAEHTGRRWIGCDLGRYAIHVTRKRLLGIEGCKPFEILNLGKYERQYWQGVTFGEQGERALYEYLAFVLKLYAAEPLTGLEHIHGKKGTALVHIGAVDAPVTIDEVYSAVDECVGLKASELHVLGWEWEMGLNDLVVGEAAKRGVKLVLRQIPREAMEAEAVRKGDVRFFELAYVQMEAKPDGPRTYRIELQDFVLPNTELIPEDVREKITKWSDYIDYWSIDWDFQNDTFMQGWVAYRTRKERKLPLVSDAHTYAEPGTYRVLVKVIDIFGNDTTQALDIEVS